MTSFIDLFYADEYYDSKGESATTSSSGGDMMKRNEDHEDHNHDGNNEMDDQTSTEDIDTYYTILSFSGSLCFVINVLIDLYRYRHISQKINILPKCRFQRHQSDCRRTKRSIGDHLDCSENIKDNLDVLDHIEQDIGKMKSDDLSFLE
jgi:hypothetical protein